MGDMNTYEQLVDEETTLVRRVQTLEHVQQYLFGFIYEQGDKLHLLTLEDALTALYKLENDVRVELLHLRLQKARMAATLRDGEQM